MLGHPQLPWIQQPVSGWSSLEGGTTEAGAEPASLEHGAQGGELGLAHPETNPRRINKINTV